MIYLLILLGTMVAIWWKKIDLLGGTVGFLITVLLYQTIEIAGVFYISTFFLVGTTASVYGLKEKNQLHLAEAKQGKRGWKNVVSNSGAAAIVSVVHLTFPGLLQNPEIAIAVCFAASLSDTLSSEMGNLTGRNYFSIMTGKPATRGQDGVVSWAGFFWGMLGSGLLGLIYALINQFNQNIWWLILLGFMGNLLDSLIGASLQRKGYLNNHEVNLLSTSCVTSAALLLP